MTPRRLLLASLAALILAGLDASPLEASGTAAIEPTWTAEGPPEGTAIVADADGAVAVGLRGEVVAVDANGEERWRARAAGDEEAIFNAPAIDAALVVVPVADTAVVALDRNSGRILWRLPMVDPRAVAVGALGGTEAAVVFRRDGTVNLLDGTLGTPRWSVPVPSDENAIRPSVFLAGGRVIVSWSDDASHLRALEPADGAIAWSVDNPKWATTPAIAPDAIFRAANLRRSHRRIVAVVERIDPTSGALIWRREIAGAFLPTYTVAADAAVVAVVGYRGTVTVLRRADGSVRWRRSTGRLQYEGEPHLVAGVVAETTYGTGLLALARRDGSAAHNSWPGRGQTAATIQDSASTGGRLFLLLRGDTGEGEIMALEASPG